MRNDNTIKNDDFERLWKAVFVGCPITLGQNLPRDTFVV
jgi:hypothetical protein